ncbi:hypothetical protein [Chitinophaga terrae (ex Kim and Jung 2007)]|uniref:hypothetical protein n=1 Tax=Chitinophaga terrae (ex Kim and Jung 2007) TaxID=408074 RepID=UPI0014579435|nr:hypothetical protein [Chitinophaga terrae (ex Kim and Jung 2007)]
MAPQVFTVFGIRIMPNAISLSPLKISISLNHQQKISIAMDSLYMKDNMHSRPTTPKN